MSHTRAEFDALQRARSAVTDARERTDAALAGVADAQAAFAAAAASFPAGAAEVISSTANLEDRERALRNAREAERKARSNVIGALSAWLAAEPADDVALLKTRFPIVLLPVRLETRFDLAQNELMVRIYPDEIAADTHQPSLTPGERSDGDAYWRAATTPAKEPDAWSRLLERYSATRAAWVVRETRPRRRRGPGPKDALGSWTRAAEARLLPDRWLIVGYRDGVEVVRKATEPVVEPLAMSLNPASDEAEAVALGPDGLSVDPDVAWAYDFTLATKAGMAVRIPLTRDDMDSGFDELFAVGVKASLDEAESASRLGALLDAHHFTRGLAFVPQGTPTNNTSRTGSGYPPPDPGGSRSFAVERGDDFTQATTDGRRFIRALGLAASDVDTHVAGSEGSDGGTEQDVAAAMNEALWLATVGYFLEQMMAPVFGRQAIDDARRYFIEHVRGRGPYPAFRVGQTPYGLLPVTSLTRWASPSGDTNVLVIRAGRTGGVTVLGRGLELATGAVREWLAPRRLPRGFGESVASSGFAAVDLDGERRLVALRLAGGGRRKQLSYSVGRLSADAGAVRWARPLGIPVAWGGAPVVASLAVGDLDGDGRPELAVLAVVDSVEGARAFVAVGRGLDGDGVAEDGWTDPVELKLPELGRDDRARIVPREATEAGTAPQIALAVGQGERGPVLLAVVASAGRRGPQLSVLTGSGLDTTGDLVGKWREASTIPVELSRGEAIEGLAVADVNGDGVPDVVVFSGVPRGRGVYRIGWSLDATDGITGGWTLPVPIGAGATGPVIGFVTLSGSPAPATVGDRLAPYVRALRGTWHDAVPGLPRIGPGGDPDLDLLQTLGMDASTREVWIRTALGRDVVWNLQRYLGALYFGISGNWPDWVRQQRQATDRVLKQLGPPAWDPAGDQASWDPRIAGFLLNDWAALFRHSLVTTWQGNTEVPLSEHEPLVLNYIAWMLGADIAKLQSGMPELGERPPLLSLLLRHAALRQLASIGLDLLVEAGAATEADRREHELVGIHVAASPAPVSHPSIWDLFEKKLTNVSGSPKLRDHLDSLWASPSAGTPVSSYRAALERLSRVPSAELQRLFGETLDLSSHRLDAWITSLASSRLELMRRQEPRGAYLGGFGFVEALRPRAADSFEERSLPDGSTAIVDKDGGGYVHTPGMSHAATAAILRSAHQTRSATQGERYAVDLSSRRVRRARHLLESVRAGQPLGAVLGYALERGLHERSQAAPTGPAFERFIPGLRDAFPLVANKADPASTASPAATAGRNVADGLAFRKAWPSINWSKVAPGATAGVVQELQVALTDEVAEIDDALDAIADLQLSESVFQLVRGNVAGAAATLDASAQGVRASDPEVAQATRSGVALTHRVALVLGENPPPVGTGWSATKSARAACEPYVDGWAGSVLPDPKQVRCRVHLAYPDPSNPTDPVLLETDVVVSLADLDLRPIDVLQLARGMNEVAAASELDRRVAFRALSSVKTGGTARITYARDPSWTTGVRTFLEAMEIARAAGSLIGGARPLRPEDLVPPELGVAATGGGWQGNAALARARAASAALDKRVNQLEAVARQAKSSGTGSAALRTALLNVGPFGLPNAIPATAVGEGSAVLADLLAQAESAVREGKRRLAAATAADKLPATAAGPAKVESAVAIAAGVFGPGFTFIPTFKPASNSDLAPALAAGPKLTGANVDARRNAISKWLQGASRVRAPLERWRKVLLYAALGGTTTSDLTVAQLPVIPGESWIALPFTGQAPRAGRVSIVLDRAAQPLPTDVWAGLLIDEWTEIIPNRSEMTAITYGYDAPASEPAQVVLIAVPPTDAPNWDLPTLIDVVRETLELARERAVDRDVLGPLGQVIPAIHVAANPAGDAVGIDFTHHRAGG